MAAAGGCLQQPEGEVAETAPTNGRNHGLPPDDLEQLESLFSETFGRFGVRLTRGSLQDGRTRQASAAGTHLALYVEPLAEPWTNSRYLETMVPLTKTLTPSVFDRWPELESFDICQEPAGEYNADQTPVTAVDLSRRAAHALESGDDLLTLMLAAYRDPGAIRVSVSEEVRAEPAFQAVLEEVKRQSA